jgi:hypothetical protein
VFLARRSVAASLLVGLLLGPGLARAQDQAPAQDQTTQDQTTEPQTTEPPTTEPQTTEGQLLRGPYPFALDNDLTLDGGYAKANGWGGARASVAYGYSLAGSLWLALQVDTVSATSVSSPAPAPNCTRCGEVSNYFDVLAGLKYKLRTPIPLVPYAAVVMGPVFLFHERARGAMGIAVRSAVGARYFLYEWFGVGMELGLMLGAAAVDEAAGLDSQVRMVDINLGAQVHF